MSDRTYSFLERTLHRLALGWRSVREASFDLEQSYVRPDSANVLHGRHVFIAGLARSGTTMLLRAFHETGRFCSLTYRDMPFVLAPNLWHRMSMRWHKVSTKRERAHHDGVMIDYDSPEAFEQVFWTTFLGDSYRLSDRLVPHTVDDATIEKFRRYVAAIILCSPMPGMLYLSKNNNNILRLPSIRRAFPEALIIVPFRHPLSQALSLLTQHEKFCAIQAADPFTHAYMSWLAHHEFGLTHRPFVFAQDEVMMRRRYKSTQLEYWLMGWIQVYRYLLEHAPGVVFVSYEALCERPHRTLSAILTAASLQIDVELMARSIGPAREANMPTVEQEILNSALEIHDRLLAVATT